MDKIGNNIGYLVLKTDGAIVQSGGDLENDENSANAIMSLISLTESMDEKFIPKSGYERITVAFDDHLFNICLSNRLIYVLKLCTRETDLGGGAAKKTNYTAGVESGKGNVIL